MNGLGTRTYVLIPQFPCFRRSLIDVTPVPLFTLLLSPYLTCISNSCNSYEYTTMLKREARQLPQARSQLTTTTKYIPRETSYNVVTMPRVHLPVFPKGNRLSIP